MDSYIINTPSFSLNQTDFFIRVLVAIGIGFLIGLEREHTATTNNEKMFAGVRTFVLITLLGFLGALMSYLLTPWFYIVILMAVVVLVLASYWITAKAGNIGETTEFTAILAFILGGLTFLGFLEISLMITVVVIVLLSIKIKLKATIGKITPEEFYDFIRYVVMVLLIFPFLPDAYYGSLNVINPKEIGWVIILTSGLGFVGYVLMRVFDSGKGILLTGIIGGLISSTAVTWIFAKKSKENTTQSLNCATAIMAASSIMFIRVVVWVAMFNTTLLPNLYLPVVLVFFTALGVSIYYYFKQKRDSKTETEIRQGKPLDLHGALLFGVIYIVIILLVSYANVYFGEKGLFLSSAIAGLSDIDAITISVSKLAHVSVSTSNAQNAILIATISNTVIKMAIGVWAGSKELRRYLYWGYGLVFIATLIAFAILNLTR